MWIAGSVKPAAIAACMFLAAACAETRTEPPAPQIPPVASVPPGSTQDFRSEEHTSELQSHRDLHSFPTRRSSDLGVHVLGRGLRRNQDRAACSPDSARRLRSARLDAGL